MFIRSTDGGKTFTTPIKINDDESNMNWQWFGTMSVAPNGRIDVVWLDTRLNPGSLSSQLYYSFSDDAGLSWSKNEALVDIPFDPHLGWPIQQKMGDYYHMISDNTGAHLAWAATFNGEQDVYYGRIQIPTVSTQTQQAPKVGLFQNYPNPFLESTAISYSVHRASVIQLNIKNELGQLVTVLVNEKKTTGDYKVIGDGCNPNGVHLNPGVYFYELVSNGQSIVTKRMVLIK